MQENTANNENFNKPLLLLVDDNPANIQVAGSFLRDEGLDIAIATNGEKAIKIAQSRKPDIILLDIMMPELDGFEVCAKLKEDESTKDIPIIFLTAKNATEDIVKAFSIGAVDFITKPFNLPELISRVNTHLKLKFFQDQIIETSNKLEQLNLEKNELLGIAAHDLKNPIYSISMLAKVIRDDNDLTREELEEFSQDIVSTAERMLDLIKKLLDINAMEQGKINIKLEQVNVLELIHANIDSYQERAIQKDIQLILVNPDNLNEAYAYADRSAIMQIIDNLLSNAIKYSPFEKKVFVNISISDETLTFSVKDQGPGLSEEDQTRLFGTFAKLSSQPTGNEYSNGLGLSIVKKYVDSMNGNVYCKTKLNEGCDFIVELPRKRETNKD